MHGRTDIGKKCTCRGKSRDALTDITGERSWCKKRGETSLEKDPTPLGIKSFGIRIYAAAVQSFVADFTSDGEEETSSRDEIKRRNIYVTFSLSYSFDSSNCDRNAGDENPRHIRIGTTFIPSFAICFRINFSASRFF